MPAPARVQYRSCTMREYEPRRNTMSGEWAEIDARATPPRVSIPRAYNAAVDFVDRHVAQGRGARIAIRDDTSSYDYTEMAARTGRAGHAGRRARTAMQPR